MTHGNDGTINDAGGNGYGNDGTSGTDGRWNCHTNIGNPECRNNTTNRVVSSNTALLDWPMNVTTCPTDPRVINIDKPYIRRI